MTELRDYTLMGGYGRLFGFKAAINRYMSRNARLAAEAMNVSNPLSHPSVKRRTYPRAFDQNCGVYDYKVKCCHERNDMQ